MADDSTENPALHDRAGLCSVCRHAEIITNARGSVFFLCSLSRTDVRFPRYPRLPVRECPGFEQQSIIKREKQ